MTALGDALTLVTSQFSTVLSTITGNAVLMIPVAGFVVFLAARIFKKIIHG